MSVAGQESPSGGYSPYLRPPIRPTPSFPVPRVLRGRFSRPTNRSPVSMTSIAPSGLSWNQDPLGKRMEAKILTLRRNGRQGIFNITLTTLRFGRIL